MSVDVDLSAPLSLFPLSTRPDNLPGSLDGRGKNPKANKGSLEIKSNFSHAMFTLRHAAQTTGERRKGGVNRVLRFVWFRVARRELRVVLRAASSTGSVSHILMAIATTAFEERARMSRIVSICHLRISVQ